jgi:membrane-bound ClpP family serine protease
MSDKKQLLFDKGNYTIMLAGIALIVIGFVLMTMETAEYGFGPLGLTIGPGSILAGFLVEIYAILHKGKSGPNSTEG